MKKYPKIAALLGWTEIPNTEGAFLQPVEMDKFEQQLANSETAAAAAVTAAETAGTNATTQAGRITELETQLSSINTQMSTATTQLSAVTGQLATAKTEITRLEALETAKPTTTVTGADPMPEPTAAEKNKKYLCSYDSMFS